MSKGRRRRAKEEGSDSEGQSSGENQHSDSESESGSSVDAVKLKPKKRELKPCSAATALKKSHAVARLERFFMRFLKHRRREGSKPKKEKFLPTPPAVNTPTVDLIQPAQVDAPDHALSLSTADHVHPEIVSGVEVGGARLFMRALRLKMTPRNLLRGAAISGGAVGVGALLYDQLSRPSFSYPNNPRHDFANLYSRFGGTRDLSAISNRVRVDPAANSFVIDYLEWYHNNNDAQKQRVEASLEDSSNSTGHVLQLDSTYLPAAPAETLRQNGEWVKAMADCMPGGCRYLEPDMYAKYRGAADKAAFLEANGGAITAASKKIRTSGASPVGQFIMLGDNVVKCASLDVRTLADGSELQVVRMSATDNHILDGHAYWSITIPKPGGGSEIRMGSFHLGSSNAPLMDRGNVEIAKKLFSHLRGMAAATFGKPADIAPIDWVRQQDPKSELLRVHQLLAPLNTYGSRLGAWWVDLWGRNPATGAPPDVAEVSVDDVAKMSFDDIQTATLPTTTAGVGNAVEGLVPGDGYSYSIDAMSCLTNTRLDHPVTTGLMTQEQYVAAVEIANKYVQKQLTEAVLDPIMQQVSDELTRNVTPESGLFTLDPRDSGAYVLAQELFTKQVLDPVRGLIASDLHKQLPHLEFNQASAIANFAFSDAFLNKATAPGGLVDSSLQGTLLQAQFDASASLAQTIQATKDAAAASQSRIDMLNQQKAAAKNADELRELQEKVDDENKELEKINEESQALDSTRENVDNHDALQQKYEERYQEEHDKMVHPEERMPALTVVPGAVQPPTSTVPTAPGPALSTLHASVAAVSTAPNPLQNLSEIYSYHDDGKSIVTVHTAYRRVLLVPIDDPGSVPNGIDTLIYLPPDRDLVLYAYDVFLRGGETYTMQGHNFKLFAHSLTVMDTAITTIDVSGISGYDDSFVPAPLDQSTVVSPMVGLNGGNGGNGADGGNGATTFSAAGGNAGNITIDVLQKVDLTYLSFKLTGGNGGRGQLAQPGQQGANGPSGGGINARAHADAEAGNGGNGGNGGDGGNGGVGGAGGNGGQLTLCCPINGTVPDAGSVAAAGAGGAGGGGGAKGAAGHGGNGGHGEGGTFLVNTSVGETAELHYSSKDGAPGVDGTAGSDGSQGATGANGLAGSVSLDNNFIVENVTTHIVHRDVTLLAPGTALPAGGTTQPIFLSAELDHVICAEGCVVHLVGGQTCSLPGRSLTIFADALIVDGDGVAVLDVSGVAGALPAPAAGKTGSVRLTSHSADPPVGPNGGPGQDGATGSTGGTGGKIVLQLSSDVDTTKVSFLLRGGQGGVGQNGQDGQDGGVYQSLGFFSSTGPPGNGGNGGHGGPGGVGGQGGVFWSNRTVALPQDALYGGPPGPSGASGQGGVPGGGSPPPVATDPSTRGTNGSFAVRRTETPGALDHHADPDHMLMLLAQVWFQYLMRATLAPLDVKTFSTATDPNIKYIADVISWVKLLSLDKPAAGKDADKHDPFYYVRTTYAIIYHRIALGRDYYGNDFTYVPEMVLHWWDVLKQLDDFEDVQKAKDAVHAQLADTDANRVTLAGTLNSVNQTFDTQQAAMDKIAATWPDVAKNLPVLSSAVTAKQAVLTAALGDVVKAVEADCQCDWQSIAGSLSSTLMAAPMALEKGPAGEIELGASAGAIVAGGILGGAASVCPPTLPFGSGGSVSPEYLISSLQHIQDASTMQNMKEGYILGGGGVVTPDDPGCHMLVVEQQQFLSLCDSYLNKVPGGSVNAAKAAFADLLTATQALNTDIIAYNADLAAYNQYNVDKAQFASDHDTVQTELNNQLNKHPELVVLVRYFDIAYKQQLAKQVYQLYFMSRVSSCLSGVPSQALASLSALQSSTNLNYATLKAVFTNLQSEFMNYVNGVGSNQQQKTTVTVDITDSFLMQGLQQNEVFSYCFDPAHKDVKKLSPELLHFNNLADVRLISVGVYLIGATPLAGTSDIRVHIVHNGAFTIVGTDDKEHNWQCPEFINTFIYSKVGTPSSSYPTVASSEVQVSLDSSSLLVPLMGPFGGVWTITAPGANVSKVTAVRFVFNVSYRSYGDDK